VGSQTLSASTPGTTSPAAATRARRSPRHNSVVNALFHHADHAGAAACKEPHGLSSEDVRRPNLHVVIPSASLLTDVVVSHPLAPSHLYTASRAPLLVAQRAESYKQARYREVAATQSAVFLPFAVESTGGIGKSALSRTA
jgi:hypothetical protein